MSMLKIHLFLCPLFRILCIRFHWHHLETEHRAPKKARFPQSMPITESSNACIGHQSDVQRKMFNASILTGLTTSIHILDKLAMNYEIDPPKL